MTDDLAFDGDLTNLDRAAWLRKLRDLSDEHGHFERLGKDHVASFIEDGRTLIVSFETATAIRKTNPGEEPRGWSFVRDSGWSALTLVALTDTWFRDPAIYAYFDRLIDDGFFDGFEEILFYGIGQGGYAAAAYSVSAPGARVLALQPQATLDPALAGWDNRFKSQRRRNFSDRFGFAPDMIEAAEQAVVVHDPTNQTDAMHAALFRRPCTLGLCTPRLSARIDRDFDQMGIMEDMIEATMHGAMTAEVFGRLWRARRRHLPYLRSTLQHLEKAGRYQLGAQLCRKVVADRSRPMFQRKLDEWEAAGLVPGPGQAERLAEPAE